MRLFRKNTTGSLNLHYVNKKLSLTLTDCDQQTVAFEISDYNVIQSLSAFFYSGSDRVTLRADTGLVDLYHKGEILSAFGVGIHIFDFELAITEYFTGLKFE